MKKLVNALTNRKADNSLNKTTTLAVHGMSCGACESRLKNKLEKTGIKVVNISAANNNVELKFNENVISLADIQAVIAATGFTLTAVP